MASICINQICQHCLASWKPSALKLGFRYFLSTDPDLWLCRDHAQEEAQQRQARGDQIRDQFGLL